MKWAFLYTLDDPKQPLRTDRLGSLICIGVPDVEAAPEVVRALVAEGVELIELCGGFGGAGLAAVTAAAQGVPVGAVFYAVDASAGLQRLFATAS